MSVTTPKGFRAAGVTAGLKASGNADLALVVNDGPNHAAAGVFTTNKVVAAPVMWSRQVVAGGRIDAVVLNSGGANACTGPRGFGDTHHTAEKVGDVLNISAGEVAVCSTGLIGEYLPMDKLLAGIEVAAGLLSDAGGPDAARAIMTTDTRPKEAAVTKGGWSVGGMAKGAGMIAPGMATMLVALTTDAVADAQTLDAAVKSATSKSFDRLDVDGCMSTNDTVLLLASGASGITPSQADLDAAVFEVCDSLRAQIAADGEGATKDIAVTVANAASEVDALAVARAVARSNLFKCAMAGGDPNWGRIVAAAGSIDATFEAENIDVAVNGVWVCRDCAPGEDRATVDMSGRDVAVVVDLHAGDASATVWTNDLTADYVHINAEYST